MSECTAAPPPTPGPGVGRIMAGTSVILAWALVHWVLFYLFFASGAIVDVLVYLAREILLHGGSTPGNASALFNWAGPLQAGLILAGAAGIPLGLAVFWRSRRKLLLPTFWIALILGAGFELYALYSLLAGALSA